VAFRIGRRPTAFGLAIAIATISSVIAVVVVLLAVQPAPVDESYFYPVDAARFEAVSAVAFVLLAIALRRRQEAAAYALTAAACFVAGWGIQAVWQNSITACTPMFELALLGSLALIPAPTAVLSIFASTAPRRLAPWIPKLLGATIAATVIAICVDAFAQASRWSGDCLDIPRSGTLDGLLAELTTPLPIFIPLAAGILGSVRNEALRFTPGSTASPRRAPTRGLFAGFGLALLAGLGLAVAWALAPGGGSPSFLLPLLAALIGIVAARWSAFVGWSVLAVSVGLSAFVILNDAVESAVGELVLLEPGASWTPPAAWVAEIGLATGISIVAVVLASNSLIAARAAMPGRPARVTPGPMLLSLVALAAITWEAVSWWLTSSDTNEVWLVVPLWTTVTAIEFLTVALVIAAAEAARGRLVPAVAEAEAVARRPLRPFRYLETLAIEALTGRAGLRRAATAAERARLASDLHAELLPSLAEVAAQHEAGASREDVAARLRRLEREVRDLMAERRLVVLEEFGILEAIEWLLGRAEERASVEIELAVDDRTTTQRPPRDVERAAFRIAQLAVENALQHASPTRLALEVLARADQVRISVSDNGRGFGDPAADPTRDHLGMADMRSQAADVHGDVRFVLPPAGGTTVTFAWPAA
jgi:signal transduction histidine kinase